jgi:5-methylcytosine-specific restriction protein A
MLAPTPCLQKGCPAKAIRNGKCKDHTVYWQGSLRKQTLPKDWRTRRLIVLRRDRGICYICNEPNADRVDHIEPGENHSLDNLAPIHDAVAPHCHRFKSSQEGHKSKAGSRVKPRR